MGQIAFFLDPLSLPDREAYIYRKCKREMRDLPPTTPSTPLLVPSQIKLEQR